MKFLLEQLLMLINKFFNNAQHQRSYPFGQSDRFQPKFALAFGRCYVDVRRFSPLIGVKMKTVRANS
ncbi:MAG: hypothetical protein A2075_24725 [Geobacteraceae bacterium GWC2_58_44]|nr:MAG: hypothetical protein A2075_24725 [Geobacteraceae bacterium GWC2_58_44]